jgi:putative transposase
MKRDGERAHKHIEYDDIFLKATFPTTRKGKAKVEPGVGVRMNYLEYWCEAMRDATIEGTQVKVRYDPFDVSVGFAYIDGQWRKCDCPYTEFAGCSERELQLLTEELRRRNRLQYGREQIEISQEQLATFRRDNAEIEKLLRQQQNDRETKAALVVLEGGRKRPEASTSAFTVPSAVCSSPSSENTRPSGSNTPEKKPGKLLVFRRIPS